MRVLLAAAGLAVVAVACGGDSPAVTDTAAGELRPDVAAVRSAAAAGEVDAARHQLDQLRAEVDDLEGRGELSTAAAERIRRAASDVEARLALATTTTTAPPPPTTRPNEQRGGEERGPDEERGNKDEKDD